MAQKGANGEGSIRKRSNGTWEARVTIGVNPETGKMIAKSIYSKTQKEIREKLDAWRKKNEAQMEQPPAPSSPNAEGEEPVEMTIGEWLNLAV